MGPAMRQQQRQRSPQEEADDFRLAKRLQVGLTC